MIYNGLADEVNFVDRISENRNSILKLTNDFLLMPLSEL